MYIVLKRYNLCRLSDGNTEEQDVYEVSESAALENINVETNTEEM